MKSSFASSALQAALCAFGVLLSSCATREVQAPTIPIVTPTAPTAELEARRYRIAPTQSQLHILVYRGGTMANLGHNHVISCTTLSGQVWLHETLAKSGFDITLPVNELIVDDAQARASEGADFVSKVGDAAREGTKRNMLKPELLDGEHYPVMQLRSMTISGTREQPQVTAQITLKNQTREVTLPVQLTTTSETLRAKGEFEIRQTDFGITPYSVMLGALQVLDQLKIKFELVAVAE